MWSLSALLNASLFFTAGALLCMCLFFVLHYKKDMLLRGYGNRQAVHLAVRVSHFCPETKCVDSRFRLSI